VRQDTATGSALKMTYLSCHAQPPRQDSRLSVITSPPTLCPPPGRGLHRSTCQAINQAQDAIPTFGGLCWPADSQLITERAWDPGYRRTRAACSTRLCLGHGPNAAQIGGDMHALFQACGEAGTPVTMVW
jgi:hypothetical protein